MSLALRHVEDPESFINDLHGGLPHTQEYLLREVLAGLVARGPRLHPQILDPRPLLSGAPRGGLLPRCDPAPPGLSGRELVDLLQRSNLFTISLDARASGSATTTCFQNLLSRQLQENAGAEEIATLHSRASEWFESQGLITESIEHALAAGDVERAADIVERHRIRRDRCGPVVRRRAVARHASGGYQEGATRLLLTEAWVAYGRFRLERIVPIIERVTPLLEDEAAEPSVGRELAFFQGSLEYWVGQAESSRRHLEEALSQITDPRLEGEAELALSLARCMVGQKEKAIRALEDRIQRPSGGVHALASDRRAHLH